MKEDVYAPFADELRRLDATGSLRVLPEGAQEGKWITDSGHRMLNLSSNDYLGLAGDTALRDEFLNQTPPEAMRFSASSSRLLTGNFAEHRRLEQLLASLYGAEAAIVFSSGYHMNAGILPALADRRTLILADKLVHASLIDSLRLSAAKCLRFRHQDYDQLRALMERHHAAFDRTIIVTESVFSMDGDVARLQELVDMKHHFPGTLLYVDEAHAVGVRGRRGLGLAEEQACLDGVDILCGTFGKALASVGAFTVCRRVVRDYLVNRMRPLIFTTALPPVNMAWTRFVVERLTEFADRRERLAALSARLREAFARRGQAMPSESHIVPLVVGESSDAVRTAVRMQRLGFYVLPIRPPTVPEGTSRLRFSLTAALDAADVDRLTANLFTP